MGLEALELAEGRQRGVGVTQMRDEAEVELPVLRVVGEAAAVSRLGGCGEIVVGPSRMVAVEASSPLP